MSRKDPSVTTVEVLSANSRKSVLQDPSAAPGSPHANQKARLFDHSIVGTAQEAVDFIANILESSTEYSVIAKDLTGKILLWNEGAAWTH